MNARNAKGAPYMISNSDQGDHAKFVGKWQSVWIVMVVGLSLLQGVQRMPKTARQRYPRPGEPEWKALSFLGKFLAMVDPAEWETYRTIAELKERVAELEAEKKALEAEKKAQS